MWREARHPVSVPQAVLRPEGQMLRGEAVSEGCLVVYSARGGRARWEGLSLEEEWRAGAQRRRSGFHAVGQWPPKMSPPETSSFQSLESVTVSRPTVKGNLHCRWD